MEEKFIKKHALTNTFVSSLDGPSNPPSEDVQRVLAQITTDDLEVLKLGKEIILEAYKEECDKAKIIEQRAYQMIQFSKVALTILFGIATFISTLPADHLNFKSSLFCVMLLAAILLLKSLIRGSSIMYVGTIFRPSHDRVKLDSHDLTDIQALSIAEALRLYSARLAFYYNHTAKNNIDRIFDCKCCFVNIIVFMCVFCLFFGLCFLHILAPDASRSIALHPTVWLVLGLLAGFLDNIVAKLGLPPLKLEENSK